MCRCERHKNSILDQGIAITKYANNLFQDKNLTNKERYDALESLREATKKLSECSAECYKEAKVHGHEKCKQKLESR
jgi:hypothetical protein